MRLPSEDEHVEFKEAKHNFSFDKLVDYCAALANERGGKIVLGVTDALPRRSANEQLADVNCYQAVEELPQGQCMVVFGQHRPNIIQ